MYLYSVLKTAFFSVRSRPPFMSPLTLRHKLPSHVFASHHLRLAFAPLRACSALPCSCLEPSALGVRPALFSTTPQKPAALSRPCLILIRHRLSISFGRNMPSASSSLASSGISHTRTHFVHNLYTKNRTAENRAPNLHPRWQHAGTQNTAKKLWRITSPLKPSLIPEIH